MADGPASGGEVDARTTITIEVEWPRLPVIAEKRTNGECQMRAEGPVYMQTATDVMSERDYFTDPSIAAPPLRERKDDILMLASRTPICGHGSHGIHAFHAIHGDAIHDLFYFHELGIGRSFAFCLGVIDPPNARRNRKSNSKAPNELQNRPIR